MVSVNPSLSGRADSAAGKEGERTPGDREGLGRKALSAPVGRGKGQESTKKGHHEQSHQAWASLLQEVLQRKWISGFMLAGKRSPVVATQLLPQPHPVLSFNLGLNKSIEASWEECTSERQKTDRIGFRIISTIKTLIQDKSELAWPQECGKRPWSYSAALHLN